MAMGSVPGGWHIAFQRILAYCRKAQLVIAFVFAQFLQEVQGVFVRLYGHNCYSAACSCRLQARRECEAMANISYGFQFWEDVHWHSLGAGANAACGRSSRPVPWHR